LTFADLVKDKKQNKTNISQLVMTSKISNELNQKKKIENNIIISGIAESDQNNKDEKLKHDQAQVIELLQIMDQNLNETNVKRLTRLPRRNKQNNQNQSPELLLVEIDTVENKSLIMQKAKKLEESGNYENVYINNDKTEQERIVESKLRAERNERNSKLAHEIPDTDGRLRYNLYKQKKYFWGIRSGELRWVQVKE
jgi:hypothetical protein